MFTAKFLGDICTGSSFVLPNFNIEKGLNRIPEKIKSKLKSDLTVGNLECPLGKNSKLPWPLKSMMMGDPTDAKILRKIGINALALNNNHILDHGSDVVRETLNSLRENNILPLGINTKLKYSPKTTVEIRNKIISIVNVCTNIGTLTPVLHNEQKIPNPSKNADINILLLHWGYEYTKWPSKKQVEMAHDLINKGYDIIIGNHTHSLQPIEKYKNKYIAYSLGDFIFPSRFSTSNTSGVITINIKNGKIDCSCVSFDKENMNVKTIKPISTDFLNRNIPQNYEMYVKMKTSAFKKYLMFQTLKNIVTNPIITAGWLIYKVNPFCYQKPTKEP